MEAPKENNGKQWVGFALYVPAIIWIAYQVTQRDFIPLMVFYIGFTINEILNQSNKF